MQVQIKQAEITTAIKNYLSGQGIMLAGKNVEITFTAGRKEGGLSADISIEDSELPEFVASTEQAEPVALHVVRTEADVLIDTAVPVKAEDEVANPPAEATDTLVVKTTSLFS